jgi:hypothetical protein
MSLEPIKNPVTGENHFAQIVLPRGFEFHTGEMASADFNATGAELAMQRSGCYGVMTYAAYGPQGLIRDKSVITKAA